MIRKAILVGIALLVFTCIGLVGCVAPIRGSGNVVEEKREVSGFDRVRLDGIGELILTQGDDESLVIEAEDNLMEYIKTSVRGDELIININSPRRPLVPTKTLRFYVTVSELEGVSVDGAGSVEGEDLDVESIEFSIDGAGDIKIL